MNDTENKIYLICGDLISMHPTPFLNYLVKNANVENAEITFQENDLMNITVKCAKENQVQVKEHIKKYAYSLVGFRGKNDPKDIFFETGNTCNVLTGVGIK